LQLFTAEAATAMISFVSRSSFPGAIITALTLLEFASKYAGFGLSGACGVPHRSVERHPPRDPLEAHRTKRLEVHSCIS
jgi:hypothetical protein